jgi:hypothetical protein
VSDRSRSGRTPTEPPLCAATRSPSPRDISLIERRSQLAPGIEELLETFSLFNRLDPDIVRVVDEGQDPRYVTYQIGDVRPAAKRLRALAAAIESGLSPR